jgi:hypothetical protein
MTFLGLITISAAAVAPVAVLPPAMSIMVDPARGRREEQQTAILDVAIMANRERLWSGSMRVGNGGAEYSETLRQAPEPCAGRSGSGEGSLRYVMSARQLSLRIDARGVREPSNGFSVRLNWERPLPSCEGGSRGVSLNQQIEIAPGATVRLSGDAGLALVLTRRADEPAVK